MAVNSNRFYLGYPGSMLMLPGQTKNSNPTANPLVQGNSFVGLNGTLTLDRLAIKKSFQLSWDYLSEADFAPIDAVYHTMRAGSPRLIDLRHTNLLSRNVSVGGSYRRSTKGFNAPAIPMNSNTGFEAGTSPWAVVGGTLTQASSLSHSGSKSGLITPTAASAIQSETMAVTAGVSYTVSAWQWFTTAVTNVAFVEIDWYTAGSVLISTSRFLGSAPSGIWTFLSGQATAPATATIGVVQVGLNLGGTPNPWYVDDVTMAVTVNTPAFQTYTDLPSPMNTMADGGIAWSPGVTGQQLLTAFDETPTIPASSYLFSAYVKAASGTVSLVLQPYDITGAALTATVATAVAQTGAWQRLVAPAWTPPATAATVAVGLQATGTVQVNTTGWQLQIDSPGNALAAWLPGWGVPKIVMPELDVLYPYPGWVRAKLYCLEA